jgi:small GTP-binding protein
MPMPHRTFAEVAKRRLVGKEGSERVATIRALLGELPGYRNGPYADLRKWLEGELERTRMRAKVVHRDSLQVRREGAAQVALVGPPNAGKSSLLQALSDIQIKTGDYAFTTLRPVPALTRMGGVLVQLVEIPGLIEGAHEDRGGGRALLGVLRNADAIVFCRAADQPPSALEVVRAEVAAAGIEKPSLLALTKADELGGAGLERIPVGDSARGESPRALACTVQVSVLDDESLERLREAIWGLTGLIRVLPRRDGKVDEEPFALTEGATVADLADRVHHELGASCTGALVWGPSARFDGQRVGRAHVLSDGDVVEVVTR